MCVAWGCVRTHVCVCMYVFVCMQVECVCVMEGVRGHLVVLLVSISVFQCDHLVLVLIQAEVQIDVHYSLLFFQEKACVQAGVQDVYYF